MPPTHRSHAASLAPQYEAARPNARDRGYDGKWEAASAAWLRLFPWCVYCALDGNETAATLVDHLYPHRGDRALFWKKLWWVSSCASCHSGMKQAIERAGKAAIDALARRIGRPVR